MQRESASTSSRPILGSGNNQMPTSSTALTTATITATVAQAALSANSAQLNPQYGSRNPGIEPEDSITSPAYSSITAQNIRQEFRGNLGSDAQPIQPQQTTSVPNLENIIESTVGLRQVEMMRNMEERLRDLVPRIVAESLQSLSRSSGNVQASLRTRPPQVNLQPPPLLRAPAPNVFPSQIPARPTMPSNMYQQPPMHSDRRFHHTDSSHHLSNMPPPDNNSTFHPYETRQSYYPPPNNPDFSRRPGLDKWGVNFDGTSKTMGAQEFVFRVEEMRKDYGNNWSEVLRHFHQLLSGDALEWYWMQRRLQPINSWEELKEAVINRFRRFNSDGEIQRQIMDRRQHPQELFEDFYNAVLRLRSQQSNPIGENELIDIMKTNLRTPMAQLVFPIRIFGLSHFRTECKKAESLLQTQRQSYSNRQFAPRVHELDYDESAPAEVDLDAINSSTRYVCWNCRQPGHGYMDCPSASRRLFCFKCGMENTVNVHDARETGERTR
ncbi:hypothetical protein CVS40_11645 [Lucilia cuprina]|nr:hypothetical protein CVS40_11645 [Lucilia cuprina]